MTPEEIQALEDAALATELETRRTRYAELRAGDVTPEVMEELRSLASEIEALQTESDARAEAAQTAEAELAELDGKVAEPEAEADEGQGEDKSEGDENKDGDKDGEGDGDGAKVTETKTEEKTEESKTTEAEAEVEAEPEKERQPVAASAIAPRRPARSAPRARTDHLAITASADVAGVSAGSEITERQLDEALLGRFKAIRGSQGVKGQERIPVASVTVEYPEERQLDLTDAALNMERINELQNMEAVRNLEAITAAGGVCAPLEGRYDLTIVGSSARPVRDALVRTQARRGGIRFVPNPTRADVAGGVGIHTREDDEAEEVSLKTCATFVCEDPTDAMVHAVWACATFGNFNERSFPEQVAGLRRLLEIQHASVAETQLLDSIATGSTATTAVETYGAARTVLSRLTEAVAGFRSRNRIDNNEPLRLLGPAWVPALIRADLARHKDNDRLELTDQQINAMIRASGVTPQWYLDSPTAEGQVFAAQGAGELLDFPATAMFYLFHEGAWLFLDQGELDLGVVRDSTLNARNEFSVFQETFEGTAFVGVESLEIEMTICPDGSAAPLAAELIECTGS